MKNQQEKFLPISTALAFALIPLGGFATDIYIPSLPAMARDLGVSVQAAQLSLLVFMSCVGVSQLFIGGLLDSYGRYQINIAALVAFAAASFTIALSRNIELIYVMRGLQGITVALIIVGKRAFFVDVYSGDRLKHYTSLFSIVWATAPIVAPFVGGYLQHAFGWQANFVFLGMTTLILLLMELRFSGESLQTFRPFSIRSTLQIYRGMIGTIDFILGLLIVGLCYSLLIIYGMASPFIIEKVYGYTAVTTGYSSLVSGVSLMCGGILSKLLITKPLFKKLSAAVIMQLMITLIMTTFTNRFDNIYILLSFTIPIHLISGFIFNNIYAYSLRRFISNAGSASGLTGGAVYMVSSAVSYGLIHLFTIKTTFSLSMINVGISLSLLIVSFLFIRSAAPIIVSNGDFKLPTLKY